MTLIQSYCMTVTELLSASSITIGSESSLNITMLLRSLHMWCEAPESMTHFGAVATVQGVSQKVSQSPIVARAAVLVSFFTFDHSFICL